MRSSLKYCRRTSTTPGTDRMIEKSGRNVSQALVTSSASMEPSPRKTGYVFTRGLTPRLTGAGARSAEGTNKGHENAEGMALVGVRVEPTVRPGAYVLSHVICLVAMSQRNAATREAPTPIAPPISLSLFRAAGS